VIGDTIQIEQVLVNLMRTASRRWNRPTKSAGILTFTPRFASLMRSRSRIQDNGRGLPGGDSGCVFEPFFSTKPEGMGIGLGISRSIIEYHGGRLWASPAPQGGAVCSGLRCRWEPSLGDGPANAGKES